MKNNILLQRGIKIVCLILVVLLLMDVGLLLVNNYDYCSIIVEGFYQEPKNSLDVVFLGASELRSGFSSAYAYERYGFTSYPYAFDSNSCIMHESQIREILNNQNPQLIVIEINSFLHNKAKLNTGESRLRRYLDNLPRGWNRIRTIFETIPKEEQINYLFPLAKYHSNWKSLRKQIRKIQDNQTVINRGYSLLKGIVTNLNVATTEDMIVVANDYSTAKLEEQSEQVLHEFLKFCKDNQLDNILFVRFPHIIRSENLYERFQRCNEAERIIEEYGFDFLNLERDYEDIGLIFPDDFYNDDHAYLTGQRKLTEYLSRILVEEYGLTPRTQSEKNRMNWETSAKYYGLFYEHCENLRNNGETGVFYETRELVEQLTALENEKS